MLSYAVLLLAGGMLAAQDDKSATMPADVRKQIETHMLGECTYQATWGDKTFKGEEAVRWTGRKTGLLIQGHSVTDGKRSDYVLLLGWDAGKQALVGYGFNSEGETWTTHWTTFAQDKWEGDAGGTYQGIKWESPCKLAFGKDSNRYEDITNGKPWVGIYTRKPSAGKKE